MHKKILAGAVALLFGAAGAVALATPASAHTPTVSATCDTLTVNASYYDGVRPAQGAETVTIANPDYVPAQPGTPAQGEPTITVEQANPDYVAEQAATFATETRWRHPIFAWSFTWSVDKPEYGWVDTGERRQGAQLTPHIPAQGTPTISVEVANPAYVPEVPGTPAVGEPTIEVANPDHVPASTTPNAVEIIVDGDTIVSASFGSNYAKTVDLDGTADHAYTVSITAWNDPTGSKGWTKTVSGTTTACEVPVVIPTQPADNVVTGSWSVPLITCDSEVGDEVAISRQITTTPYVLIDNEWVAGESTTATETDTHTVTADEIAALDCAIVTPPTEEPEVTVTPTPEATPEASATPKAKPVAVTAPSDDNLAETGGVPSPLPLIGGALALAIGAALVLAGMIRRHLARN